MTSLLQLNKLIFLTFFFILLLSKSVLPADAEDIWKQKENENAEGTKIDIEKKITIEGSTLGEDIKKISIEVDQQEIKNFDQTLIGIFDPQDNDFNLNMWVESDGQEIKKILKRINKIKLSKFSEDLLFQVLFTNSYPPKQNLSTEEFKKIKINWLIKNKRLQDLENFLKLNPSVGSDKKVISLLINDYLSSANVKSACEKMRVISKDVKNDYLDKFLIYCLINEDRKNEAQLIFDLFIERGNKDLFFQDKINFLLGLKEKTNQNIKDDNLLNFYLSHITSDNFEYQPTENTDKYIWRYLSSANLIKTNDIENEELILTYEKAAAEGSFDSEEIFKIYEQILFNINQLINAKEVYKNLPTFKARALIYQSILLTDDVEKKLYLTFLLKDLFEKENKSKVYLQKLLSILKSIEPSAVPNNYEELVERTLERNLFDYKKIKFDNEILHRSKVIKHFLEEDYKASKTEKDFKSVYKKIKRNKKYFISIKDIIVLESLQNDGVKMPSDLDFAQLSSQLTVPQNLQELVEQDQVGLLVLKVIEIIGEDKIDSLDPETIYFLNKILNELNLKKIRNRILSLALPVRV
tara:strand:+ start:1226 stop:2968 length:1743 start_codon:yes stop_codon:yes gene_type:complete